MCLYITSIHEICKNQVKAELSPDICKLDYFPLIDMY